MLFIYFLWLHGSLGGEMKCDLGESVAPCSAVGASAISSLCTVFPPDRAMSRIHDLKRKMYNIIPTVLPLVLTRCLQSCSQTELGEELISDLTKSLPSEACQKHNIKDSKPVCRAAADTYIQCPKL